MDQVKKLADTKRDAAETQAKLIATNAFRLTDDPTKSSGPPTPLKSVPHFNMAPLENAIDHLKRSAMAYDRTLAANCAAQSDANKVNLIELARQAEQTLAVDVGLPGRDWYKHLIYAPGRYTGYAAKTLPGVREAIEEERWADVDRYAALTGAALESYADKLDDGVRFMGGTGSVPSGG
jgi:N-acetylated-alpha-linked acidic dipeptidase